MRRIGKRPFVTTPAIAVALVLIASACAASPAAAPSPSAAPVPCAGTSEPDNTTLNWSQRRPDRSPAPRGNAAMSFDAKHGQLVLFGGQAGDRVFNDTWTWDGATWTEQTPASAPPARHSAGLAADPTGALVLFGGFGHGGDAAAQLGDTWTWDGHTWTEQKPAHSPQAGGGAIMVSAGSRGVLRLGGFNFVTHAGPSDTWLWDGHDWTPASTSHTPPLVHEEIANAAAADRDGSVLYFSAPQVGIANVSETWRWDGQDWSQANSAVAPPSRRASALTFLDDGTALLFGGSATSATSSTTLNDTWAWTSSGWRQLTPGHAPTARFGAAMQFDPVRREVVLFGGTSISPTFVETPLCDTWTWRP